ncbi:hypothetical protein ACP275_09G099800 [Erythranthe tilingii]
MADDAVFSPAGEGLSPNSGIEITMEEEASGNSEELLDDEGEEDFEIETNALTNEDNQILEVKSDNLENAIHQALIIRTDLENECEHVLDIYANNNGNIADAQTDHIEGKSYLPPVVGMEFESYEDAYNYYNCYAKELGFGIRVKSSWTKRNSKEKRGAVLCCNCEGFKTTKEASTQRKETRTGCQAMIRLRLVESSNRWRLDEVKIEHNHLFDHEKAQNSRSHKKTEAGAKRKLESAVDVEIQTIKLFRTPVSYGSSSEREPNNNLDPMKRMKFGNGDILALYDYFRRSQLTDPNFFYIMDLSDEGYLRNVFWIDSRSRAAYSYFGDVVVVDTTCVSNKYDVPLLSFSGLNHHGESLLLGCCLLVDETLETYIWLMRAWLTCLSGRAPQTIITDRCKFLQGAIYEVLPRSNHRLCLPHVMRSIQENLEVRESEMFRKVLDRTVYASMKVEEFETRWEEMVQRFAVKDHDWLRNLYEDREKWVPVYSKNTPGGIFTGEYINPFFHRYLHERMTWSEFFNVHELLLQKKIHKEALDDFESREFMPVLQTRCSYEPQASQLYSKGIFSKFLEEIVLMCNCFGVAQIHTNGTIVTYVVKERGADVAEAKNFEVVYDKVGAEVRCVCGCFNFRGYLCRHALSVLSCNGVEEIPSQYILTRWRKDVKRIYSHDFDSNGIDVSNPVQRYDHLYRRAMQVVAEGMGSREHHMVAWQAFKESLNKVRLAAEKPV